MSRASTDVAVTRTGWLSSRATFPPNTHPLADASVSDAPGLNVLLLPSVDPWSSFYALLGLLALLFASALIVCATLIRFISLIT